jgi:hypothetical protein
LAIKASVVENGSKFQIMLMWGVRLLIGLGGVALIVLGVIRIVDKPPDDAGGALLLFVGLVLLAIGLYPDIKEFGISWKGVTFKREIMRAVSRPNKQLKDRQFVEATTGRDSKGQPQAQVAGMPPTGEITARGDANRVVIANAAMDELRAAPEPVQADVADLIAKMATPGYDGGIRLPGTPYRTVEVNSDARLVFRPLDVPPGDGIGGYGILDIAQPGSEIWNITDKVVH